MTPLMALPPLPVTPARSAAIVVVAPELVTPDASSAGYAWPEGIDYERWTPAIQPSPRESFGDRLDILEQLAD
jgi:hypothetical protein